MRTFLFGAGASHSYSGSATKIAPPLARDFFSTFNQLAIAEDPYVRVGAIVNYVRDTRGLNPFQFQYWNENIEDFLTEIDKEIGGTRPRKIDFDQAFSHTRAYDQLIFLFGAVLNEIQNGRLCGNYAKLVRSLGDGEHLITFNWDTLLDRALWERGKWDPADGYRMSFKGFFNDRWTTRTQFKPSKNQLLKLHGSTNWLMPYYTFNAQAGMRTFANPTISPSERPIYCFLRSTRKYRTYQNRSRTGYSPLSYFYYPPDLPISIAKSYDGFVPLRMQIAPDLPERSRPKIGYPATSMPFIIAPIRKKQYSLAGNALDSLWRLAESAVATCSELFIVGYSFPVTDTRAWKLLESACRRRGTRLQIHLIDPYPEQLLRRLKSNLRGKIKTAVHKITFAQFCEEKLGT